MNSIDAGITAAAVTATGQTDDQRAGDAQPADERPGSPAPSKAFRRQRRLKRARGLVVRTLWRVVIVVAIGVTWEWAVNSGRLDLFYASKPSVIIDELQDTALTREFWTVHAYATFKSIFLGLALGSTLDVGSALVLGRYDRVYSILSPFITGFYSLPKIALAPLTILWFGIGISSKVALVVSVVFFAIFYNTHAGVKAVDRDMRDAVRMMGSSQGQLWRYVILPSTAPWIMAGLRVSVAFAFTASIVGELIASQFGLGNLLAKASGTFQTGRVFAILVVLGVLGVMLYAVVDAAERYVLRWRGGTDSSPSGSAL